MGCISPCARIESASSCNDSLSIWVRGWYLPGARCDTFIMRRSPCGGAALSSPPSNASSPRPSPLGFAIGFLPCCLAGVHALAGTLECFLGQFHIGSCTLALTIVGQHRQP